jgi:Lipocalin-like domain
MTRARIAIAVAAVTIGAASGASAGQDTLEGVWRFQEEVDRRADGSLVTTGSTDGYDGILIFTNGYMSSTLVPKGRTWARDTVSAAELRETFEGSSAHAGRYEVDSISHTIKIESIISLDPGEEGKWLTVHYLLEKDSLSISGPWTYHGEELTFTLRLARVE